MSLLSFRIDVGFTREAPSQADERFNFKRLFSEKMAMIVPDKYPVRQENFDIAKFRNEPFILPPTTVGSMYYENLLKICERGGFKPDIRYESNFGATILRLVEQGLGVALMPISYRNGSSLKVRFIELHDETSLYLIWRKDDPNPVLHNFLKICDEKRY
jgi:DNA-binding transcriptional LysR family regulator